jgi:hypothetical protein
VRFWHRLGRGQPPSHQPFGSDLLSDNFDLDSLKHPNVVAAIDQWRQGDIISGLRMFGGISEYGKDPLSGAQLDPLADGEWGTARESLDAKEDVVPPEQLGIIVWQTCDVVATDAGARHPTVQVAPIVNLTTAGRTGAGTPGVLVSARESSCSQRCQPGHSNPRHRNDSQQGG